MPVVLNRRLGGARGRVATDVPRINASSDQARELLAWFPLHTRTTSAKHTEEGLSGYLLPTYNSGSDTASKTAQAEFGHVVTTQASGSFWGQPPGIPNINWTKGITLCGWFFTHTIPSANTTYIGLHDGSQTTRFLLYQHQTAGYPYALADDGPTTFFLLGSAAVLPLGQWAHLCVTYSEATTTGRLYVQGVFSGAERTNFSTTMPALTHLSISAHGSGGTRFEGQVRDIRLYGRALSESEVYALYAPQSRWDLWQPNKRVFVAQPQVTQAYFYVDPVSGNDTLAHPTSILTDTPTLWTTPYQTVAAALTDMAAGSGTEQWLLIKGGTTVQEGTSGNPSIDLGTLSGASAGARLHIDAYDTGVATIDGQSNRSYGITGTGDFIEITNRITITAHTSAVGGEGFGVEMASGADDWDCEPTITGKGGYRIITGKAAIGGNVTTDSGTNDNDGVAALANAGVVTFKASARITSQSTGGNGDAVQFNTNSAGVVFEEGCVLKGQNTTKQVITVSCNGNVTGHVKLDTQIADGTDMVAMFIRQAVNVDLEVECLNRFDKCFVVITANGGVSGTFHVTGQFQSRDGLSGVQFHPITITDNHPTSSTFFIDHCTVGRGSGGIYLSGTNTVTVRNCGINRTDATPAAGMRILHAASAVTLDTDFNGFRGFVGGSDNISIDGGTTDYDTLAAYQAGEPTQDQSSVDGDPLLKDVSSGLFRIKQGSAWEEAGQIVTGGRYLDDAPYVGQPDIGAFGYILDFTSTNELISFTGNTATINLAVNIAVANEAVSFAGNAATIQADVDTNFTTVNEALSFTGNNHNIGVAISFESVNELVSFTGNPAQIGISVDVAVANEAISFAGNNQSIQADVDVAFTTVNEALSFTGNNHNIAVGISFNTVNELVSFTGNQATIQADVDTNFNATNAPVHFEGNQAVVDLQGNIFITQNNNLVSFTGNQAIITTGIGVNVTQDVIEFTGNAAQIQADVDTNITTVNELVSFAGNNQDIVVLSGAIEFATINSKVNFFRRRQRIAAGAKRGGQSQERRRRLQREAQIRADDDVVLMILETMRGRK